MTKKIWFDMDGTIANLYAVEGWLDYLMNEDTFPYANAATMLHFATFARTLNRLQADGQKIGIISWTSKCGSESYNLAVEITKREWLAKHLPSVEWDEIKVVRYGTNKWEACGDGILFDDEKQNREVWKNGLAFEPCYIMEILKEIGGKG